VIRYYHHECDDKFLYLALQYCPLSLHQLLVLAYEHEKEKQQKKETTSLSQSLNQSQSLSCDLNAPHLQNIDLSWFTASLEAKKLLLLQLANGILHLHTRNIGHFSLSLSHTHTHIHISFISFIFFHLSIYILFSYFGM
jgi:hypothetical protein